ncbi:DUF6221 family protein [[Kitasatospora] papulosa]|uniref:DUF6221 family protein n=1 Tax=[Kitasatospora] papulosa TaxID=1464011 RepID=UPI0037D4C7DD
MTDLAGFLRARYEEARQNEHGKRKVIPSVFDGRDVEWRYAIGEPEALYVDGHPCPAEKYTEIATAPAPDPDAIADLDAKLALLNDLLADQHYRLEEDNWYFCAALKDEDGAALCFDESRAPGPCDCGRDARVNRRLRILAQPFADHPNYQEAWRP